MKAWGRANPDKAAALVAAGIERARQASIAERGPCEICGMTVGRARARTCGQPECERIQKAARMREAYEADKEAARRRIYAARAVRTPEQVERDKEAARRRRQERGYDETKRAGDARRRALKRGALVERFTNGEIFDRDGWRCGICGKRINRKLTYPHPLSVSLDHVIPLSLGGEHSRANVRAAHLSCNVQRGAARDGADQLALI